MEKKMVAMMMFMVVSLFLGCCDVAGNVYKVGDEDGWTVKPNYTYWTSTKNFKVGDTILFQYDAKLHNVIEVKNLEDYRNCDKFSAIATYSSGNDSFLIITLGHRFFMCGFPGHCAAGQKVDIRVLNLANTSALSPTAMPPTSSPNPSGIDIQDSPAPTPQTSSGNSINKMFGIGIANVLLAFGLVMV
ncbi:Cupredoxins domain-containing protein [Dioscorea alata]|uniref:Cupredoxins domain-containing protein n=1 Tax=Dioscorea alata TaxID=55571 RepID=A0ACB7U6A9_DIOAL|nr:Cupredoxins domain-containing protein [Dioscorea alata]